MRSKQQGEGFFSFILWLAVFAAFIYGLIQVFPAISIDFSFSFGGTLDAVAAFFLTVAGFATLWWVLVLYAVVVSIFYDEDWVFLGLVFLAIPAGLWLIAHGLPHVTLAGIATYAVSWLSCGVVWSFFKWMLKIARLRTKIEGIVNSHDNWSQLGPETKGDYIARTIDGRDMIEPRDARKLDFAPKLSKNKARVTQWICYWPFSVLNYVFGKLLKDLVNAIITKLSGVYDAISNWMMKGLRV